MKLERSPLAPDHFPELPAVKGMKAATHSLGLYGPDRDDLLVVHFPDGANCGGVFTRSATRSADVDWCRSALRKSGGKARALVVNAGNSNAFTGLAGVEKNSATIKATAEAGEVREESIYLAATGVIGEPMEADRVARGVSSTWPDLSEGFEWEDLAKSFMTTDTFAKGSGRSVSVDDRTYAVSGIIKGSGMIAPNMATMLCYVFTDAPLSPTLCQKLVSRSAETTLNCVTIDSDTSTSDTCMLFATGAAGGVAIEDEDDPRLEPVADAVHAILLDLAHQLVRDGEGATKFVDIAVSGGANDASAKVIACAIANSPLVKTALSASDANWGRVVMAAGKSGEPLERDKLTIWFGNVQVAKDGQRDPDYSEEAASAVVERQEISIRIDVGVGNGQARVWTCDLSHGYVTINGAYRT